MPEISITEVLALLAVVAVLVALFAVAGRVARIKRADPGGNDTLFRMAWAGTQTDNGQAPE